jgi:hypothetical protein
MSLSRGLLRVSLTLIEDAWSMNDSLERSGKGSEIES